MAFSCPLCREEWLVINKLCPKCEKVRFIMASYSRDVVIEALEKIFLIRQFLDKEDDENEYEKQEDGSWKKKVDTEDEV